MNYHLVSYATYQFRHRQIFLNQSALANGIVSSSHSWNPNKLLVSGFQKINPRISLSERGSGFWAWKPFVIRDCLNNIPDGDVVLYCDVGRRFPYILLEHSLGGFIEWMNRLQQDIMPGVLVPWNGTMEQWTKRDAFIGTGVDNEEIRSAPQIQASFSLWRNNPSTRAFVAEWHSWCIQRQLISDDSSIASDSENFKAHRHDQSLLNLCCFKYQIHGLDIGHNQPTYNERNPSQIAEKIFGAKKEQTLKGRIIQALATQSEVVEKITRKSIRLGKRYE